MHVRSLRGPRVLKIPFVALLASLTVWVAAQPNVTCPELVERALDDMATHCETLDRNMACYGYNRVGATFTEEMPDDFFTLAGDQARLLTLETLETSPYNLQREEWGAALLSIQADLPNTLPGQTVTMILLGDAQVENAVTEEDAFTSDANIPFDVGTDAVFRSRPTSAANVVGSVKKGDMVAADAVDESGEWVRAAYVEGETGGWMPRSALANTDLIGRLPIKQTETRSPLQAFYFSTGVGASSCTQAPTSLVVQGPQNQEIDIAANGTDVRITSTGVFRTNGKTMLIGTVSGTLYLYPDTPDEIAIPAGYVADVCLVPRDFSDAELAVDVNDEDIPVDRPQYTEDRTCPPPVPRPMTEEELASFVPLEQIPPELLNYPIRLPGDAIIVVPPAPTPVPVVCTLADWRVEYEVQEGDTISDIAKRYNLFPLDLANGNCLPNPDLIHTGQILRVPTVLVAEVPTNIPTDVPTQEATRDPATQSPPATPVTPTPPDIEVTVYGTPNGGLIHETEAYTVVLTARNLSTVAASNVVIDVWYPDGGCECDQPGLPAELRVTNTTANNGTFNGTTWTIPSIGGSEAATLTLSTRVLPGNIQAEVGVYVTLTSAATGDTDAANNDDSVTAFVDYYSQSMIVSTNTLANAADGVCSLTEAIDNVNTSGVAHPDTDGECPTGRPAIDSIALGALSFTGVGFTISADVAIAGAGEGVTYLESGGLSAFKVDPGVTFSLARLKIGNSGSIGGGVLGGAIGVDSGTLVLDHVTLGTNAADQGGALYLVNSNATLTNTTFNNNTAGGPAPAGGAIYINGGTANLNGVTFNMNAAPVGGAIFNTGAAVNLTSVTFVTNTGTAGSSVVEQQGAATTGATNVTSTGNTTPQCNTPLVNNGGNTGGDGTCF